MKKALGSLVAFENTLFNDDTELVRKWTASGVKISFSDEQIQGTFTYDGELYNMRGRQLKSDYYQCVIYISEMESGKAFFWIYINSKGFLLLGEWVEVFDGVEEYNGEIWGRFDWSI
jgi:hypothetical protein